MRPALLLPSLYHLLHLDRPGVEDLHQELLSRLQLLGPDADRLPGVHLSGLPPPGPSHEYASKVACAHGFLASAFLPLAGACSL